MDSNSHREDGCEEFIEEEYSYEESSEEELCEEVSGESYEEEIIEEVVFEEEKSCAEEVDDQEDPSEEEFAEELEVSEGETASDRHEEQKPEEDPEDPEPSYGSDEVVSEGELEASQAPNIDSAQLVSPGSRPMKNGRSASMLQDNVVKSQKLDKDSETQLHIHSPRTNCEDKKNDTTGGSSCKKKRSRWDMQHESNLEQVDGGMAIKKRKSRWDTDETQLNTFDPLTLQNCGEGSQKLYKQLVRIDQKLNASVHDNEGKADASSLTTSANPNESGIQKHIMEARCRAEVIKCKQKIISSLYQKEKYLKPLSLCKPLSEYKPPKLHKKLYVPVKQYPEYNFIGLILGPRGNTQKRMEMETGAKILLRGKGSKTKDVKYDAFAEDDLHVHIEADNQKSLDAAVEMIKELLIPIEEGINAHKHAQLRELAALEKKLAIEGSSSVEDMTLEKSTACNVCGSYSHFTAACPLTASAPGTGISNHQVDFFAELGSRGFSPFSTSAVPFSNSNMTTKQHHSSPSPCDGKSKKIDEAKLFVCHLPQSVEADKLVELFLPFGYVSEARVIKDNSTGLSKGYGFVRYSEPASAAKAVARMNGYRIDGKTLLVKVAGQQQSTTENNFKLAASASFASLKCHTNAASIAHGKHSAVTWPNHSVSTSPEPQASFPRKTGLLPPPDSSRVWSPASFGASDPISATSFLTSYSITSAEELEQFPGYVKSIDFQDSTLFTSQPSMLAHPTNTFNNYNAPFSHSIPPP